MPAPDSKVYFYPSIPKSGKQGSGFEGATSPQAAPTLDIPESGTCVDAETFALRVLDESMQPEFKKGCIIIIDPTGRATDGSYVLARTTPKQVSDQQQNDVGDYIFRQLKKVPALTRDASDTWALVPLNTACETAHYLDDLSSVVGVIVQRAGVRRRYHKHYD